MDIGIPKETKTAERRVALVPETCAQFAAKGHSVHIETGAGMGAGFMDEDYRKNGAIIDATPAHVYEHSELIIKVKEPQTSELAYLKAHHLLFCFLHLAANPELAEALCTIGLTAVGFETVEENGHTPLLSPMSAIAGRLAVQIGSYYLHTVHGGSGVLIGGTSNHPAGRVTVIGAGVAGSEAALLAAAMGAEVTVFDLNADRLSDLNRRCPPIRVRLSTPSTIYNGLPNTDLLIGAVYIRGRRAPHVVTRDHIKRMKRGSVAVDISIDQGGCFETSRPCTYENPIYTVDGVLHSAIANLPAAVPHTASLALSQAILPYALQLAAGEWTPALCQGINVEKNKIKLAF